jgi:hypothetical protein
MNRRRLSLSVPLIALGSGAATVAYLLHLVPGSIFAPGRSYGLAVVFASALLGAGMLLARPRASDLSRRSAAVAVLLLVAHSVGTSLFPVELARDITGGVGVIALWLSIVALSRPRGAAKLEQSCPLVPSMPTLALLVGILALVPWISGSWYSQLFVRLLTSLSFVLLALDLLLHVGVSGVVGAETRTGEDYRRTLIVSTLRSGLPFVLLAAAFVFDLPLHAVAAASILLAAWLSARNNFRTTPDLRETS